MHDVSLPTRDAGVEADSLLRLSSRGRYGLMGRRLRNLKRSLSCFRTASKVVVFESDDWGMDGMPSREVYDELTGEGRLDSADCFNKCGRETVEDLNKLFDVLGGVRDETGRHPVMTANFVMANPDFQEIEASGFRNYSWAAIDDVVRRPKQAALIAKHKEGIEKGLMHPQYHGRDHLSAEVWLEALRGGDPVARAGFRRRVPMAGNSRFLQNEYTENCNGTLKPSPRAAIEAKVGDGIAIFQRAFGFRPLTSIAPHYMWCDDVERSLYERGVRCMQAAGHRLVPSSAGGSPRHMMGTLGERSPAGLINLSRNCWFRPSEVGEEAVSICLKEMASAFASGYPAVIDTHRVNYVEVVDSEMRNANLHLLRQLLRAIVRRFSKVRFATSPELGSSLLGEPGQESALLIPWASIVRRASYVARERCEWWLETRRSPGRREHPARKANH